MNSSRKRTVTRRVPLRQTRGWRFFSLFLPPVITFAFSLCAIELLNPYFVACNFTLMLGDKILISAAMSILFWIALRRKRRAFDGIEHGSSRWGKPSDIKPFVDPEPCNNIILSATEQLSMDQRRTGLANNVLIVGDVGSGKSRGYAKPNIMQMNASYVITDPSGEHLFSEGKMLKDAGYDIKVFDITNPANSLHFNPFHYYTTPKEIREFIDVFMENTSGDTSNPQSKEDFWIKAERLWLSAHINYVLETCLPEEKNMCSVMKLLNVSEARDEDESFVSAIDIMFRELEQAHPDSFAVLQYKKYKLAAGVICSE